MDLYRWRTILKSPGRPSRSPGEPANRVMEPTANVSIDDPVHSADRPWRGRFRLTTLCVALLMASFLSGAAATGGASPDLMDVAKIVSVVAFVGSMVALCMGMIGDAYRP